LQFLYSHEYAMYREHRSQLLQIHSHEPYVSTLEIRTFWYFSECRTRSLEGSAFRYLREMRPRSAHVITYSLLGFLSDQCPFILKSVFTTFASRRRSHPTRWNRISREDIVKRSGGTRNTFCVSCCCGLFKPPNEMCEFTARYVSIDTRHFIEFSGIYDRVMSDIKPRQATILNKN
jgi:hypothetical protein